MTGLTDQVNTQPVYIVIPVVAYAEFLNAVAPSDPYGLYNMAMGSDPCNPTITRSDKDGSYTYKVVHGKMSASMPYLSLRQAAHFCNWYFNCKPSYQDYPYSILQGYYQLIDPKDPIAQETPQGQAAIDLLIKQQQMGYYSIPNLPNVATHQDNDGFAFWQQPLFQHFSSNEYITLEAHGPLANTPSLMNSP